MGYLFNNFRFFGMNFDEERQKESMRYIFLYIFSFLGILRSTATDTLKLDYATAEKMLLERNLSLIAFQYNLNINDAIISQAKLWENPILSIEQGIYDDITDKWFDVTKTGQQVIEIQQLIVLAGKRNKNIKLQKDLKKLTEYEFAEIASALRFELIDSYYTLDYIFKKIKILEEQINPLQELSKAFYEQFKKGNVAFREASRLSSLVLSLKSEKNQLSNDFFETQKTIKKLIGDTSSTIIQTSEYPILELPSSISINDLQNQALENRPILKSLDQRIQISNSNLKLQKALAVPDLYMGLQYDRAGSYIMDYRALTLSMPLPVFDRNQNFIKIAQYELEIAKSEKKYAEQQVRQEVKSAFEKLTINDQLLKDYQEKFDEDFRKLLEAMLYNYQKKNITLTEFVDFYESYKDNVLEFLEVQLKRTKSIEELNYYVGKKVF
ncbi:MAG: TolC family protein [Cytophagales bacterium]